MPIDPSILGNFQQGSLLGAALGGIRQGQDAYYANSREADAQAQRRRQIQMEQAAEQQRRAEQEQQAAEQQRQQQFGYLSQGLLSKYGDSVFTPDGQKGLIKDFNSAGFGREGMGLVGEIQKSAPKAPEPPKPDEFKPVKNRKGQVVGWNPKTGLGIDGKPVDAWQEPKPPDGPKSTDIFSQEQQLRNQYLGQTRDYRAVRDAFARVQASAKDPSPAGDLSLIFAYMKILDPTSTVREGEFANAQQATGVPDRILNQYNKILAGERLNPAQRNDFVSRAKALYGKQEFQAKKTKSEYERIAKSYPGLDPKRILMDDSAAEEIDAPATQGGFKILSVED